MQAEGLEGLIHSATETETEPDRHGREALVLAGAWQAILGNRAGDALECLDGLTFVRADYSALGEVIRDMPGHGGGDEVMVRDALRDNAGALTAFAEVLRAEPVGAGQLRYHAARMRKAAESDRVRALLSGALATVVQGGDPDAALGALLGSLATGQTNRRHHGSMTGHLEALESQWKEGRKYRGLETGIRALDNTLDGLNGVVVLAAAPGTGKTTMAKQIADFVAEVEQVPTLFFAYEPRLNALYNMSLARLSGVPRDELIHGKGLDQGGEKYSSVLKAAGKYAEVVEPFQTLIQCGPTDTASSIHAQTAAAMLRAGASRALVVVDYLQRVSPGKGSPDTIRERTDHDMRALVHMTNLFPGVAVLVISSLNREGYKDRKAPCMASLKESGGIEFDADAVVALWRADDTGGTVEARVLKNRAGALGKMTLTFRPETAAFEAGGGSQRDEPDELTQSEAFYG